MPRNRRSSPGPFGISPTSAQHRIRIRLQRLPLLFLHLPRHGNLRGRLYANRWLDVAAPTPPPRPWALTQGGAQAGGGRGRGPRESRRPVPGWGRWGRGVEPAVACARATAPARTPRGLCSTGGAGTRGRTSLQALRGLPPRVSTSVYLEINLLRSQLSIGRRALQSNVSGCLVRASDSPRWKSSPLVRFICVLLPLREDSVRSFLAEGEVRTVVLSCGDCASQETFGNVWSILNLTVRGENEIQTDRKKATEGAARSINSLEPVREGEARRGRHVYCHVTEAPRTKDHQQPAPERQTLGIKHCLDDVFIWTSRSLKTMSQ
ncbi:uncharacterized protein LOC119532640 [Choloepus didactylus]|uniref:uncharacterized protein LOC119532640 n=1 Tax=Choloepus didactylus TaxID=27675 RepID=UPI00189DFA68|nr:uncharacterized protein LOC119532640 [Choloepus didactylus]